METRQNAIGENPLDKAARELGEDAVRISEEVAFQLDPDKGDTIPMTKEQLDAYKELEATHNSQMNRDIKKALEK